MSTSDIMVSPMASSFAVDRIAERGAWISLVDLVDPVGAEGGPDVGSVWERLFVEISCRSNANGVAVTTFLPEDASITVPTAWSLDETLDNEGATGYIVTGYVAGSEDVDWVDTFVSRIDNSSSDILLLSGAAVTVSDVINVGTTAAPDWQGRQLTVGDAITVARTHAL